MSTMEVDTTRLPLMLHDLRLPAIARLWTEFAERADTEGWPAARFLSAPRRAGSSSATLLAMKLAPIVTTNRRPPIAPWTGVFKLSSQLKQGLFIAIAADELYADWQALIIPVQRHGHCWMTRGVEQGTGMAKAKSAPIHELVGISSFFVLVQRTERERRLAEGGRKQDVNILKECADLTRELIEQHARANIIPDLHLATVQNSGPRSPFKII